MFVAPLLTYRIKTTVFPSAVLHLLQRQNTIGCSFLGIFHVHPTMVSCSVILINLVWILLFQRGLGMCGQSPDPGSCFQNKRRWYFNPISKTCQAFVWGGCGGTAPFNSFAACLAARCASPKLPACKKLPRQGNCSGTIRGWFYDRYTRVSTAFHASQTISLLTLMTKPPFRLSSTFNSHRNAGATASEGAHPRHSARNNSAIMLTVLGLPPPLRRIRSASAVL